MPITRSIQQKIQDIIAHQLTILHEREDVIPYVWTNRVAQQHILLVGGPGTGKTMVARNTLEHITGGYQFETSLDETSDPSVLFGPTDVKGIVEDGKQRRVIDGMLPEATDAFIDEIFNANGPTLRSTQPILNERIYHQGREALHVPLRSMMCGTNQLTTEIRLKPMWDRIHQRHLVEPVRDLEKQMLMVAQAVERMDTVGRGLATEVSKDLVTVTVEDLEIAHHEALKLGVSDDLIRQFFALRQKLQEEGGISVSDRRMTEGMVAILANAWVRGHEEVTIGDFDVLQHMWWTEIDDRIEARNLILEVVNPGDKKAMDGFEDLKGLREDLNNAKSLDASRKPAEGVQIITNASTLIAEAKEVLEEANRQGWPTEKIERLIAQTDQLIVEVHSEVYGLGAPGSLASVGRR